MYHKTMFPWKELRTENNLPDYDWKPEIQNIAIVSQPRRYDACGAWALGTDGGKERCQSERVGLPPTAEYYNDFLRLYSYL